MVSASDRDRLELSLALAEFWEALHHMPTDKSPGMDGLTLEFYRVRAVLALLPKKRDLRDLQNWRPVSLLSKDYKIIAKAISLRLGSVLADVIHPDQTYTVPDHSIFDNLFLVQDLLELGRRDGLSFALLSLDQEKAFDRVDHRYLLSTLQAFGFGPQFVGFLRVLYASAECLVKLNWTLTEPVSFGQGIRQGCPLSGQLYALAIEPFLCLLCRRLIGLVLREPELRLVLSAYADDVLLVIQDPGDLAQVEACQAIYSAASSARVNWVKSSGLAVGDWRQMVTVFELHHAKNKFEPPALLAPPCTPGRVSPSTSAECLSQTRRGKKRSWKDMLQEILQASAASENGHKAWRMTLADSMEKDRVERRKAQEKEKHMQQEKLLRQKTDMLQILVDLQAQQSHASLPLQPMENSIVGPPYTPFSIFHVASGVAALPLPCHLGDRTNIHSFTGADL
ncbi:unnamed protein product [Caretta caretta]